jgi:siroheme synthase
VAATLATIAESAADLSSPALIVVGDVVALSERLRADRGTLAIA